MQTVKQSEQEEQWNEKMSIALARVIAILRDRSTKQQQSDAEQR